MRAVYPIKNLIRVSKILCLFAAYLEHGLNPNTYL